MIKQGDVFYKKDDKKRLYSGFDRISFVLSVFECGNLRNSAAYSGWTMGL